MAERPDVVLIAGPTASGKSGLAVELARRHGGAVVNADSMQVYAELPILTAQPTDDARGGVEHLLYGHVPASRAFSVGDWLAGARRLIGELREQGRMAVFAGGTGLYFEALEGGLAMIPDADPAVRDKWRALALGDPGRLHVELASRDPGAAAALRPGDTQPLARALEVFETTGRSIHHWQREGRQASALEGLVVHRLVIEVGRDELASRIGRRFDEMMSGGALDEVRALMELRLDPALPAMRAIGVPQLGAHLRGELDLPEAVDRAKAATRQYAKRQRTWLRHRTGPLWRLVAARDAKESG